MMCVRMAIWIVAYGAAASGVLADQAKAPRIPPAHPVPIQAYASDNPSCLEWTDGCTICTKAETGAPACSTPGIACQQAGIQCKKTAK
jgi:hypothetical protein